MHVPFCLFLFSYKPLSFIDIQLEYFLLLFLNYPIKRYFYFIIFIPIPYFTFLAPSFRTHWDHCHSNNQPTMPRKTTIKLERRCLSTVLKLRETISHQPSNSKAITSSQTNFCDYYWSDGWWINYFSHKNAIALILILCVNTSFWFF